MLLTVIRGFCQMRQTLKLSYASYESTLRDSSTVKAPLVVLHGLFGSKSNWNNLCKQIHADIDSNRIVIAVDHRNHGESPHHPSHSYEDLSLDLKALLTSLKFPKVSLLGHSMGGRAAMLFSLRFPYLVEKLIVVDISPVTSSPNLHTLPFLINAMENVILPTNVSLIVAKTIVERQLQDTVTDKAIRGFLLTNLIEDANGTFKWRLNIKALKENFQKNIAHFPIVPGVTFRNPTLFIKGEKSDFLPDEDYPKILEIFPAAQFVVFPDAGHWVHAENPALFLTTALRVETANPLYFSAYITNRLYKVADIIMEC